VNLLPADSEATLEFAFEEETLKALALTGIAINQKHVTISLQPLDHVFPKIDILPLATAKKLATDVHKTKGSSTVDIFPMSTVMALAEASRALAPDSRSICVQTAEDEPFPGAIAYAFASSFPTAIVIDPHETIRERIGKNLALLGMDQGQVKIASSKIDGQHSEVVVTSPAILLKGPGRKGGGEADSLAYAIQRHFNAENSSLVVLIIPGDATRLETDIARTAVGLRCISSRFRSKHVLFILRTLPGPSLMKTVTLLPLGRRQTCRLHVWEKKGNLSGDSTCTSGNSEDFNWVEVARPDEFNDLSLVVELSNKRKAATVKVTRADCKGLSGHAFGRMDRLGRHVVGLIENEGKRDVGDGDTDNAEGESGKKARECMMTRAIHMRPEHFEVVSGEAAYYQGQNNKWKFELNRAGHIAIGELVRRGSALIEACDRAINRSGLSSKRLRSEGKETYARKPNKAANNITWSQEEYAHLGFQRQYIALKSVQRFTETWSLFERAHNQGILEQLIKPNARIPTGTDGTVGPRRKRLVVASLGGGPGFELLALEKFMDMYYGTVQKPKFFSLDLEETWRPYVELLGYKFIPWDIESGSFVKDVIAADEDKNADAEKEEDDIHGGVDLVILSYVFYHYMRTEASYDMLEHFLNKLKGRAVFISSRFERLDDPIGSLRDRKLQVIKLIDQGWGTDDRQLVVLPSIADVRATSAKTTNGLPPAFPNVPYEEHKPKRRFALANARKGRGTRDSRDSRRSSNRRHPKDSWERKNHSRDRNRHRSRERDRDRRHRRFHDSEKRRGDERDGRRDQRHREKDRRDSRERGWNRSRDNRKRRRSMDDNRSVRTHREEPRRR